MAPPARPSNPHSSARSRLSRNFRRSRFRVIAESFRNLNPNTICCSSSATGSACCSFQSPICNGLSRPPRCAGFNVRLSHRRTLECHKYPPKRVPVRERKQFRRGRAFAETVANFPHTHTTQIGSSIDSCSEFPNLNRHLTL